MKRGNAEIFYRMNFMMLIIVSMLFLGGVLSTYTEYIKYGLNYEVITIINGVEVVSDRIILYNVIYVMLFGLILIVSFMNCQVHHKIGKYLEGVETE